MPSSSANSRRAAASGSSPGSYSPLGIDHAPRVAAGPERAARDARAEPPARRPRRWSRIPALRRCGTEQRWPHAQSAVGPSSRGIGYTTASAWSRSPAGASATESSSCSRGWSAIAGANALESGAGSAYTDNFKLPHTESFDAVTLLQRNAPKASGDTDQIVIATKQGRLTDPAVRAARRRRCWPLSPGSRTLARSLTVSPPARRQIAPDGQVAFANVTFDVQPNKLSDTAAKAFVTKVTSPQRRTGSQFEVEGQVARAGDRSNGSSSLGFGFLAAAVVLFLVFGSLLAMAAATAHRRGLARHRDRASSACSRT